MLHFFTQCQVSLQIWNSVQRYLKEKFEIEDININQNSIIWNELEDKKLSVANYVCLVTTHYLYYKRCKVEQPNFHELERQIEKFRVYELYNAKRNNKIIQYQKKWEPSKMSNQNVELQNEIILYIESYLNNL